MGKPISLNMKRADKAEDCRLVSSLEILEGLVDDIKSGKVRAPDQVFVAMLRFNPENPREWRTNYVCAGMNIREIIALLEIMKNRMLHGT